MGVQTRESVDHLSPSPSYIPLYSHAVTTCPDISCLNQSCTGLATPIPGNQTPLNTTSEMCESCAGKACLSSSHPRLKSISSHQGRCHVLHQQQALPTHSSQLVSFPKATVSLSRAGVSAANECWNRDTCPIWNQIKISP